MMQRGSNQILGSGRQTILYNHFFTYYLLSERWLNPFDMHTLDCLPSHVAMEWEERAQQGGAVLPATKSCRTLAIIWTREVIYLYSNPKMMISLC